MKRAVIYARYSSDLQSEASIDDQVRLCRERAEREGMSVQQIFADYAISGGSLNNRPEMRSLLDAVQQGGIDVVIAEALDRVSRDQEDIAAIFKRLQHAEVCLLTLAEGEINELHVGLKGTMNALFLKDLAAKTRRGQRGRVEAGKIPGGNSYGYKIVRRLLEDGSVSTGEREIDGKQAEIVRRIFAEYAAGISPRRIARGLNAEGITAPRGGLWNASTINGSRQRRNGILNNELYRGQITYNRQRFVKDPDTGKRIARPNPEDQWIKTEVAHLRIIDDRLWEAAQILKSRYSSQTGNKRQTRKRLLSGLVKCGACGGSMTIINRERYSCSAKRERGTCDSPAGISAVELEERVLSGLKDLLLGNETLIEAFAEEFKAELERLNRQRGSARRRLQKELNKVNGAINRCVMFIKEGDGSPNIVREELHALEIRREELQWEMAAGQTNHQVLYHPAMADLYRKKVGELQTLLVSTETRTQAMESIRSLIERIEVFPGKTRGNPDVIVVGALAQILAFGQTKAPTATSLEDDGRVLMVAGARYQPFRTPVSAFVPIPG